MGLLHQAAQESGHLGFVVARDDDGQAGEQAAQAGAQVAGRGTHHGHGVDGAAELRQVRHVFGPVVAAHEGDQGDGVLLAQVAQHVVGPHFGAGVQRVGQDLGEEEEVNGQWSIANAQLLMVNW